MNETWIIITIIASTIATTSAILGVYYSHKRALENRIKDLENKVQKHEKFVEILEKRALSALEEEFNNSSKLKNKNEQ